MEYENSGTNFMKCSGSLQISPADDVMKFDCDWINRFLFISLTYFVSENTLILSTTRV